MVYQLRPSWIFVGSFATEESDAIVGGQMYAATSLLNSELSSKIWFHPVDSTSDTNVGDPFRRRVSRLLSRAIKILSIYQAHRPTGAIVFSGSGGSFLEKGLIAIVLSTLGVRVLFAPRSGHLLNNLEYGSWRWFVRQVFERVECVVCQSNSWRMYFEKHISRKANYLAIPNWVEYPKAVSVRQTEKIFTFVFVGWLDRRKGVYELLNAAQILREEGYDFRIMLAGEGVDSNAFHSELLARSMGDIISCLGWVHGRDKENLFRSADCFVLPSYAEGLPNALLEAMSFGVPVIATRVGAIPEVIESNNCGVLIKPRDVASLVESMRMYLEEDDSVVNHGINGRKAVEDKYSVDKAVGSWKAIILGEERHSCDE